MRQLITDNAQAAVLLKSKNGETLVVNSLQGGLAAAREHPNYGVIIMAKDVEPSAQLMKVSGGTVAVSEGLISHAVKSVRAAENGVLPDSLVRSLADDYARYSDVDRDHDDAYAQYRDLGEDKLAHALMSDNSDPSVPVIPEPKAEPVLSDDALLQRAAALNMEEDLPEISPEKGKEVARESHAEHGLADKLSRSGVDERQLVNQVYAEQLREQREIERPDLTPEHVKHIQKER